MSFRYQGRVFLLTWAQTDPTVDHLQIFTLVEEFAPIQRCVIAREKHQDGGDHFHMYVEHERYVDRRVSNLLSIAGRHPNIAKKSGETARKAAEAYCRKDADWVEYGFDAEDTLEVSLCELAKAYPTWSAWIDHCHLHKIPFQYCSASWNAVRGSDHDLTEETPIGGSIDAVELLLREFNPTIDTSIILLGRTGSGKTTWAKRQIPKPALFVSHVDDLKKFRPGFHVGIVFDDMDFHAWPRTSQIHLVDWDNARTIHARFHNAFIPEHTYKIFTCNVYPFVTDSAIERRVELINLI